MSNPLLRPNDPRFQRPELRDGAGQNRFAESAAHSSDADEKNAFAAGSTAERPYQPEFAVQQTSRYVLLLVMAGLGWLAAGCGAASFTGVVSSGWLVPLIGFFPAATAWLMAHEELKAAAAGAIDRKFASRLGLAFWLGLGAALTCAGAVAAMIWRQMNFLPDVF